MSSEDLEKFRQEWSKELGQKSCPPTLASATDHDHSVSGPSSLLIANSPLEFEIITNKKQNEEPVYCSQCNFHPAFRESSKCSTCIHHVDVQNQEHKKKSTQFYPFRIVDELLKSPNLEKKNADTAQSQLSQKSETRSRKRKIDKLQIENVKNIFSCKRLNHHEEKEERYLDLLIADLDEINEIPFFDTTVAREVAVKIFEHLDMVDLCRCSQVSKSWKSLADDELLWCKICHKLGYDQDVKTVGKSKWKSVVSHHIEQERKLSYNWKNRLGRFSQLQHVNGGIVCAVTSSDDRIVAGYTNGEVKLWNVEDELHCLFHPSNTSLIIDESADDGTISNNVTHVAVSSEFVVAGYRQGNVDIWRSEGDNCTTPVHVINCRDRRGVIGVGVAQHSDLVYAVSGPLHISFVHVCQGISQDGSTKTKEISFTDHVIATDILEEQNSYRNPSLLIATPFQVNLYKTDTSRYGDDIFNHVTNIHHVIGSPVTCMDVRSSPSLLAVGLGSYGGALDPYRVKVYDVTSGRLISTLYNHTWTVTTINVSNSPENLCITGSGDRRVRVFDMRSENMTHLFSGHSSQVNTVQMDDVKVVSGGDDGFVRVWDLRMSKKLWEIHNRHPVKHCHFTRNKLIVGNVPTTCRPLVDEFENATHRRFRGSVQLYDFSVDQGTQGVPDICLSTYDEPEASNYNIGLAMPYDTL